jgi:hypothetical protein
MGFGIVIFIALVIMVVFLFKKINAINAGNPGYDETAVFWIAIIIAVVANVSLIIGTLQCNTDLMAKEETIKVSYKTKAIMQDRANNLLPQLIYELDKYPTYETKLLKEWAKGRGSLINVPPDIKNADIIKQRVAEVKEANDAVYNTDLQIVADKGELVARYRGMKVWAIYVKPISKDYFND